MKLKLSICVPSRGLIHSQTVEHIFNNVLEASSAFDLEVQYLGAHSLPLPDCFNTLIDKVKAGYIWFVEDDMGFPDSTLREMLQFMTKNHTKDGIMGVTIDYPPTEGTHAVQYRDGEFDYGGMGCLLITKYAMDKVGPLRTDVLYDHNTGEVLKMKPRGWGHQDVYLYKKMAELGWTVGVLPQAGWQYKLKAWGQPSNNNGSHEIIKLEFKQNERNQPIDTGRAS